MPGFSEVLDVVIGLVFVFLLLSLIATWVQEWIATRLGWRSKELVKIIQHLLEPSTEKREGVKKLGQAWPQEVEEVAQKVSENVVKAFYEHPIIQGLAQPNQLPSYISAREFGLVFVDLLTKAGTADPTQVEATLENLKAGINALKNPATKEVLLALVASAEATEGTITDARKSLEDWYNATMDRASGWYKRRTQWIALVIGILLAILFNADAIGLGQALWQDPALRETISAAAVVYIEQENELKAEEAQKQLEELGLPLGWSPQNRPDMLLSLGWLPKIIGWLITGFAISQGSSIWFDLLGRLVNMRGTGRKPEPSATGG